MREKSFSMKDAQSKLATRHRKEKPENKQENRMWSMRIEKNIPLPTLPGDIPNDHVCSIPAKTVELEEHYRDHTNRTNCQGKTKKIPRFEEERRFLSKRQNEWA